MRTFLYNHSDIDRRYDRGRKPAGGTVQALTSMFRRNVREKVGRVLDLGCGTGRFSQLLADTFGSAVVGVDLAANMLSAASAKGADDRIKFVRGSVVAIPLCDAAVDVAFISQVLHHLPELEPVMAEIARVLAPEGFLFVRQTTRENLDSYFYQQFFPEARAIDEARLPSQDQITGAARGSGLLPSSEPETVRVDCGSGKDYLAKIALRSNSDLAMISDESFDAGMRSFSAYVQAHPGHAWVEEVDQMAFRRPA